MSKEPKQTMTLDLDIDGPDTTKCSIKAVEFPNLFLPFSSLILTLNPGDWVVATATVYIDKTRIRNIEAELYTEVDGVTFRLIPVTDPKDGD